MLLFKMPHIVFEAPDAPRGPSVMGPPPADGLPVDATLTLGVTDENEYGNNFGGNLDADGVITMTFTGTGQDTDISVVGYDIDNATEVEVFLNGESIGYMEVSPDNGLQASLFSVKGSDVPAGEHTLQFVQQDGVAFKWGVTDVLVTEKASATLLLDTENTGEYGNGYGAAADTDGVASFVFTGTGNAMQIDLQGYDIDSNSEVKIYLNGEDVGYLSEGVNNDFSDHTLNFAAGQLNVGENRLEFEMQGGNAFKWGVTNLTLSEDLSAPSAIPLVIGVSDNTAYGRKWEGEIAEEDLDGIVEFSFDQTGDDLQLTFTGFDIDEAGEVKVFLNNVEISSLVSSGNLAEAAYFIDIADADLEASNTIRFQQMSNPNWMWGIKDVKLDVAGAGDDAVELTLGVEDGGDYGNKFNGVFDTDGEASFTFTPTGGKDVTLTFEGFDIDQNDEVSFSLNGEFVQNLGKGVNDGNKAYTIVIAAEDLEAGENTITFEQLKNDNFAWGVTKVKVSEEEDVVAGDAIPLELDTPLNGSYGNKFNAETDEDGLIEFVFTGSETDLVLNFQGFDVDTDSEIGLYLNGEFRRFLPEGTNDGLSSYVMNIAAEDMLVGDNVIGFQQENNPNFKWGITNLVLSEDVADPLPFLALGVEDDGFYGQDYNGSTAPTGSFDVEFEGSATDLTLTFLGFDIDGGSEVSVYLDGNKLADLTPGVNNGTLAYEYTISADDMVDGVTSTLTFATNNAPKWKWGISNLKIEEATDDAAVELVDGVTEPGSYGNGFDGVTDADGVVDFTFTASGDQDVTIALTGYDIDSDTEVDVFLNGEKVGSLSKGTNNGFAADTVVLDAADVDAGVNNLSFVMTANPNFKWGVKDLTLTEGVAEEAVALTPLNNDATFYGNGYAVVEGGEELVDEDGSQAFSFEGAAGEGRTLRFMSYDIDFDGEVEVKLNGESQGFLQEGLNNGFTMNEFSLNADDMVDGENIVTFEQTGNPNFKWGVANMQVSDAEETLEITDNFYGRQWYWDAVGGMEEVWAEFDGSGVSVGIYDNGVDYTHEDLAGNYDASKHAVNGEIVLDPMEEAGEAHGTKVAGIIAADNNGTGVVGGAHGATITGVDIIHGAASPTNADTSAFEAAMDNMVNFDVVNNSWGSEPGFDASSVGYSGTTIDAMEDAADFGRGGLGTVQVKSAGNQSTNSNGDLIDASRFTISVAASDSTGDAAAYSNHGANLLVAAPSADDNPNGLFVATTSPNDGYTSKGVFTGFGGTSAAAPVVSSVVALMLEANPGLGWRDVQEILAMSARYSDVPDGFSYLPGDTPGQDYAWMTNGAETWNGGGMHYSEDFGFGVVHAHDAVRMAEARAIIGETAKTSANEAEASGNMTADGPGLYTVTFAQGAFNVENASITLDIDSTDVDVFLTSAEGTKVQLFADGNANAAENQTGSTNDGTLDWTFGAAAFRGEELDGEWTLEVVSNGESTATVSTATLSVFGDSSGGDDTVHTYTDEFFNQMTFGETTAILGDMDARNLLTDNAGNDWLDMSAMTANLVVVLGSDGFVDANATAMLDFDLGTTIENVITGDGDDIIYADGTVNIIHGNRGDDVIYSGGGDDTLFGGQDDDYFVFSAGHNDDVISDFSTDGSEDDMIIFENYGVEFGFDDLTISQQGADTLILTGEAGDSVWLLNTQAVDVNDTMFLFEDTLLSVA